MQNITEKDLFNFIFYPEILDKNKSEFININKQNFKDELEFLQNLNIELQNPLSDSVVEKLNNKIAELNNVKSIILNREKKDFKSNNDEYCLAAASENFDKTNCATFKDKESNYLLKLFFGNPRNKLYIFAKDDIENKNFEITLLPSNNKFKFSTKDLPFSFTESEIIDQIILNF